ncbi:unnamed protein product, partial [Amoebophrya sp. A25]|eukprot:GSA25T00000172001.1
MTFLFRAVDKLGEVADQFADHASVLLDIEQDTADDEIGRILATLRVPSKWLFGLGELRAYVETYPRSVETIASDPAKVQLLGKLLYQTSRLQKKMD